jgi:drug/metabolite transporter (DMT)-like permease
MSVRDMVLAALTSVAWGHRPFALLAPCAGVVSSAIILREMFSPVRYAGMALILGGLAVIVLPGSRSPGPRPVRAGATPRHEEELDAS